MNSLRKTFLNRAKYLSFYKNQGGDALLPTFKITSNRVNILRFFSTDLSKWNKRMKLQTVLDSSFQLLRSHFVYSMPESIDESIFLWSIPKKSFLLAVIKNSETRNCSYAIILQEISPVDFLLE